ncbi:MAG: hypothetical protein Q8Q23_03750 [bacterium]|nr:hypothetical protein [bacterium]
MIKKFNMSKMTDDEAIKNIIEKSGHDFHLKISKLLENDGWNIRNSPHYNDPNTNIPREIDIIAEKNFPVGNYFFGDRFPNLIVRLFIECKYIKSHIVFWFLEKDMKKAIELAKNNPILRDKDDIYLKSKNKTHHYIVDATVVKLFSADNKNQDLDKAINQILNATLFFSRNQNTGHYTVNFPMIIVNSFNNFKKKNDSQQGYEQINNNVEIEVEYTNQGSSEYFLIDIISEDKISTFLDYLINNDVGILTSTLYFDMQMRENQARSKPDIRNSAR